ncbi:MAG: camphor resistance protein CrcB [Solirubrobacterales bacterium]|nr:camphor resistance protein CrcB [Solirubrobacterales bacterium]
MLVRALPRLDGRELAAIFAGGAVGGLTRTVLTNEFPAAAASWPWVTFCVNVVGAFLVGYFVTRLQERLPPSAYRRPLLGTGLCGGLTTFSTMQFELLEMFEAHNYGLAFGYAATSVAAGYVAVLAATGMVRRVRTLA